MTTTKRIVAALLTCIAFSGISHAALVGEWTFDDQTFVNTGSAGAVHDGTFVTLNSNYFVTDTRDGSGHALRITSIADAYDPGGDVLLINNSKSTDAAYINTFDGTAFSVSMWIKTEDAAWQTWDEIAGKQIETWQSEPNAGWSLRSRGSTMRFDAYGGGTAESSANPLDQSWHLITATSDGVNMNLYIDGILDGSTPSAIVDASLYSLAFGARDDGSRGENVLIDDIQYYDTALTEEEVIALLGTAFVVSSDEIDMSVIAPATNATVSIDLSYNAAASVTVNISIMDESHAGAFTSAETSLTLTDTIPATTPLVFQFDNSVANLANGETATGLVTFAWSVDGSTTTNEVVVPIRADYVVVAPGGTRILWDIGKPSDASDIPATVADFTAAGVTENISGSTVSQVGGSQNNTMTDENGVTLSYLGATANGVAVNGADPMTGAGSAIIKEYIYHRDATAAFPMQIGGLSTLLSANTEYSLYIWAVGDNAGQNSTITFDGTPITVSPLEPDNEPATSYVGKFSFTTGGVVEDTLDFEWHNSGGQYAGLNGFAIVPVVGDPDPTIGDLSIEVIEGGAKVAVNFQTSDNGTYIVKWGARLETEASWTDSSEPIPGTGGAVTVTNDVSADQEFYRAYIQD